MKFIVKIHPEIIVKSQSVRKRLTRLLEINIRSVVKSHQLRAVINNRRDRLEIHPRFTQDDYIERLLKVLKTIPGIEQIWQVAETEFQDFDDIYRQVSAVWGERIGSRSFAIRVKRRGNHSFSSLDLARFIGGKLQDDFKTGGVSLKQPELAIQLEVDDSQLRFIEQKFDGLGGMPLPSQDDVLSLISGGYDSSVASFETIRRGAKTHFCFFNLGGEEHEIGVRQLCFHLWQKYSASHKVKFVSIDFMPVINEILAKCEPGYMGVILKRMMLRAATLVADNMSVSALLTGEAMGQVASQTLANLQVIDQATDKLVLRPLICADKADIIAKARIIGTADISATIPEYCGVISRQPNINVALDSVLEQESQLDLTLIEQAVRASDVLDIRHIGQKRSKEPLAVPTVTELSELVDADTIIDIRAPDEAEANPLNVDKHKVINLPFYKLERQFPQLTEEQAYYLYCDRGVMSKYHTHLLRERGFNNVSLLKLN